MALSGDGSDWLKHRPDFRLIIDEVPTLIHSGMPDGRLDFFNQTWLNYVGLSQDQLSGWAWTTMIHPQDVEQTVNKWRASLACGQPFLHEARVRRVDGQYRWFLIRNVALQDPSHRIVRWYGAASDIEDRRKAEEALQLIIDSTPAHLQSARPDGNLDFFNKRWLEYLGLAVKDIHDWDWAKVIHPEDVEKIEGKWRTSLANGEPCEAEARVRRADGEYRWHLHREIPLRDEAGAIVRWYGTSIDIENLKRTEDALRQSEERFQLAIDTIPGLVWSALPDGSVDYLNRRWQEYTGLTLQEAGGWGWQVSIHPADLTDLVDYWKSLLASSTPGETVARMRRFDGAYRWFLFRGVPIYDETGTVIKWYGQTTDIHDRKQTEEDLQKALDEIKKLKDQLYKENIALRDEIDKASMFEEIVGESTALQVVLARVGKVAPTDSTVLMIGETGTGKELFARAIHKRSRRASRAFVTVNCAAIPTSLIASELFGHEKGAFTGAVQRRLGRFELADGGTIFLDEVGELPLETQVALLRVLQEREFERVGGSHVIPTDVRIIAATNRDLQAAIAAGSFRRDLFYRLNVFPIDIPPLRERKEDISMLVEYFIDRYARKAGKKIGRISKKSLDLLHSYPWPGNIRELQNVIERSVILCETEVFSVDESWLSRQPAEPELTSQPKLSQKLADQERELIEAALRESKGRVFGPSGAATKLSMPRSTLESKIRSLKIDKNRFKLVGSPESN